MEGTDHHLERINRVLQEWIRVTLPRLPEGPPPKPSPRGLAACDSTPIAASALSVIRMTEFCLPAAIPPPNPSPGSLTLVSQLQSRWKRAFRHPHVPQ